MPEGREEIVPEIVTERRKGRVTQKKNGGACSDPPALAIHWGVAHHLWGTRSASRKDLNGRIFRGKKHI